MIVGSLFNSRNLPIKKGSGIEPCSPLYMPETYPFSHITSLVEYTNGSSTALEKHQIMMTMG
jgi:hypothetical protein